jgi:hypothetical protein
VDGAHRAQEQEPIARRLHRQTADFHRVGMICASSSPRATRRNGGRPPAPALPGKAREAEPRPGDRHRDRGRLRMSGR